MLSDINFRLLLPKKVVFGWGHRSELGAMASELGQTTFLVCGSRTLRQSASWQELLTSLGESGVEIAGEVVVTQEPTIADVDTVTNQLLATGRPAESVIAIGGGAAIDLGKAVSAIATNSRGRSVREFLEGVGTGAQINESPLPFLAVPTTAGTGSEATKNAVISVDDPPCKKSLRSEKMMPEVVIIDPELTVSAPQSVTAASGMDAITQLLESLISRRANRFTQAICRDGLQLALPNLVHASQEGQNSEARTAMSYAAFLSGVALANSGLGMAHGVAAALGAISNVPHGIACATLLPIALHSNRDVAAPLLAEVGRSLNMNERLSDADAVDLLISEIQRMCDLLDIPRSLSQLGVTSAQLPAIVAGSKGNSMSGNPRDIGDEELFRILENNL